MQRTSVLLPCRSKTDAETLCVASIACDLYASCDHPPVVCVGVHFALATLDAQQLQHEEEVRSLRIMHRMKLLRTSRGQAVSPPANNRNRRHRKGNNKRRQQPTHENGHTKTDAAEKTLRASS